jgi:hypothetical protein
VEGIVRKSWLLVMVGLSVGTQAFGAQVPSFCTSYPQTPGPGDWQASKVFYSNGRLSYVTDNAGNRVPDYSYSGYAYGLEPIPNVPEVLRLSPEPGDQTARIQAALDAAPVPGAVVLAAGDWEVQGIVRVRRSGQVLRGEGDGPTGTVLKATLDTPHQRSVVILGTGNGGWTLSSTRTNITSGYVPVNSFSFEVESTAGYNVGETIVITHPSTPAWINAVDGGGMVSDADWNAGQIDIQYIRKIVQIDGAHIAVDAPIYNHLDRSLSQSFIQKVTNSNAITQAGVEDLRVDIVPMTTNPEDENHAWNGVDVTGAHDSWVRGVTALHFGSAGVVLENAVRVTVDNCKAIDPVGIRTGSRFYNFNNERRSQLNLFTRCTATLARHSYIDNGVSLSSGIVYHRSSQQGGGSEGGHRMWVQGVLYDNITGTGQVLLINRGDFGTSHGWGTVHSTIWKFTDEMLAQQPPTGQNYAFSNAGHFRSSVYFPGPFGIQERNTTGRLVPESLYEAQLCERIALGPTPVPTGTPFPTPTPTPTPSTTPTAPPVPPGTTSYEAERGVLSGGARLSNCTPCSGPANPRKVGFIGNGPNNHLTMTVEAAQAGKHSVWMSYLLSGQRSFFISVNGAPGFEVPLTGTSFNQVFLHYLVLDFVQGPNTIRFFHNTAFAPDLDRLRILFRGELPELTVPEEIVVEATGPSTLVAFSASATDAEDGVLPVTLSPASGSGFPVGTTVVTATATDSHNNRVTKTFDVVVEDTTPPTLSLPADLVLEATSASGAVATFAATAHDLVSGDVPVSLSPPSGSTFPLGTTTVAADATDAAGNTAEGSFTVTVRDTTAPIIESIAVSPKTIWPPNHKMVGVDVAVQVSEAVDGAPVTRIVSIASNEPENGTGDGDTSPDSVITGDLTAQARAERSGGGTGRIYTITVESRDAAGNASTRTVEVTVPHDRGQ